MQKTQVINLDPIDRKKDKDLGIIGKLLITRWYGGRKPNKQEKFGHYMFCGKQRQGKSNSFIWYMDKLASYYKKHRIGYIDDEGQPRQFLTPPKLYLYSNIGIGRLVDRNSLYDVIASFDVNENAVRFVLIDEIQIYFTSRARDKKSEELVNKLTDIFCQLGKRNTYLLTTAQVFGRVDKALREQCLYMVNCTKSLTGRFKNEFIDGDDILCDQLGRWAGKPSKILIHGVAKRHYDNKRIISRD